MLNIIDAFVERGNVMVQTTDGDVFQHPDSARIQDVERFVDKVLQKGVIDPKFWTVYYVPQSLGMTFGEYFDGESGRYRDTQFFRSPLMDKMTHAMTFADALAKCTGATKVTVTDTTVDSSGKQTSTTVTVETAKDSAAGQKPVVVNNIISHQPHAAGQKSVSYGMRGINPVVNNIISHQPHAVMVDSRLAKIHKELTRITDKCRADMHEPDEDGITATVVGDHLDNAFGNYIAPVGHGMQNFQEFVVVLKHDSGVTFSVNLADLIALARKAVV